MAPYIVQLGDTLSKIAGRLYGDEALYPLIVQANNIQNINLIYPGDQLIIPDKPMITSAKAIPDQTYAATSTPGVPAKSNSGTSMYLWIGGSLVVVGGIVLLIRQRTKKRGMGRIKKSRKRTKR